jgi:hypothetical protein
LQPVWRADIVQDDAGVFSGKGGGNRPADPSAGSRDQNHSAFECHGVFS